MYIAIRFTEEFPEGALSLLEESGLDFSAEFQSEEKRSKVAQALKNDQTVKLNFYYPGSLPYKRDINHWATSSSQRSLCTVQPETAEDVSKILQTISRNREPFGVKSGGHTANPGFSSSPNMLISMKRFDQVDYIPESQIAVIGTGQIWDNVYEKLARHRVTVVGGRVTHIGVAGFILGGGYSWYTNQYGLAIDTVTAFELVKPDGAIVNVTQTTDPELFFALRGGGNNFGIVTKVTLRTFPLGEGGKVWGGSILLLATRINRDQIEKIKKLFFAVQKFADTVQDPKAAILVSLGVYPPLKITHILNFMAFYDGPSPPPGIFDDFQEIAPTETQHNWTTRDYPDLVKHAMAYDLSRGFRGTFHTVPVSHYKTEFLQAIWDEIENAAANPPDDAAQITYSLEPFLPDILSHSSVPSAYPSDRSIAYSPFVMYAAWKNPNADADIRQFIKDSARRIRNAAEKNGIRIGEHYPNYASSDTPLEEMYGENVAMLKGIKERVDPSNVMGLAGGFKF